MTADQPAKNPHTALGAFALIAPGARGDKVSLIVYVLNFSLLKQPLENLASLNGLYSEQVIDGDFIFVEKSPAIRAEIKIPPDQSRVGFKKILPVC